MITHTNINPNMNRFIISIIVLLFLNTNLYSQNETIKVKIIDEEELEALPGVRIQVNDSIIGQTNSKGEFEIPFIPNELTIGGLGLEDAIIKNCCNNLEIVMLGDYTYDFISLKKVDRLRMKRFKQLPKLHKQAYDKGIFKTEQPCYTREFIPYYKGKKKKAE